MKFGTSGLRGLSVDLKGRASALYATAFGKYLLQTGKARAGDVILIGRDFRDSSPEISGNCAGALAALGFRIFDCGNVPTPALALYGLESNAACLMVTGSHIPADRNGIKFYRPDGEIDKSDEADITALAAEIERTGETVTQAPAETEDHEAICRQLFFERNAALLPQGALSGLKIGVYQHSSVARDLLVDVLAHYGAEITALGRSESFIPVDTEAVSDETIALTKRWVSEHKFDAIVSTDGDGDRPLVADETGTPLRGDLLGLVAANFLGAGTVVTPVTSNSGIEAAGSFAVRRTRVGSPFVISGMEEAVAAGKDHVMGFEANGGLLTATAFDINGRNVRALPTRDCFIPMLAILSLAATRKQPLSAVAASYHLPFAAADRLENFPVETSAALMQYLRASDENLSAFLQPIGEVAAKSDIDGLRVTLRDGRIIHFRPSGNAPEMRCYVEAESETAALDLLTAGLTRIRDWAETPAKHATNTLFSRNPPMTQKIVPVIMAGGKGTRLWPLSRATAPKQFIQFVGDKTLFQETLDRVSNPDLYEAAIVVTNEEFRFLVAEQARELAIPLAAVLLEPVARNTAAAVAAAATLAGELFGKNTIIQMLASDHEILADETYFDCIRIARDAAADGKLVTFGITPTEPATGYGYIEIGDALKNGAHKVKRFVEKPALEKAEQMLAAGGFYWNSGIFMFPVAELVAELQEYAPDVLKAASKAVSKASRDLDFTRLDADHFAKSPDISIDYAIMEKTSKAAVVPSPFKWSDMGSWDAVWKSGARDGNGNVAAANTTVINTRNSLVMTHGVHLAVQGMDDVAVIASEDAVYVGPLKDSQNVGQLVKLLASTSATAKFTETHPTSYRPWGGYTSIFNGDRFQVKRIFVTPGKKLSLQKHHHRSEHWIVVKGTAEVTVGETVRMLRENESVYIPLGEVHRLANPGKILLELIEVQTGSYLGEDDIIRIVDEFGRT
ncbi:mannose-1-phosphate guanylyltransferase/mannose-6-phosphate isomerase [Rhizobium ruizarguesonis]|nr:mannose-1-phosphate guanylyltransferase/mannose-6-phosphate isomerase [Rhizobium ruizarguesonis]